MHLPEAVLLGRAVGRLGGLEGLRVDALERQVEHDIADLAGVDILLFDLRVRLTDVPGAVRSLVVRELDEGQLGGRLAEDWIVSKIEDLAFDRRSRRRRRAGRSLQQPLDLGELASDLLLALLQLSDLLGEILFLGGSEAGGQDQGGNAG